MDVPVIETPWEGPFPSVANWSENFLLAGEDPKAGVGFWLHVGRWRKDLTMFRETVLVRLPDDTVVANRGIGNSCSDKMGPGGPYYAIRVIEPGHKLTYSFSGGVRRVPAQSMRDGLVTDGPRTPMKYELTFQSNAGIWDLHKVGHTQEFLPAGHIEQIGRVTGWVHVGTERYEIDTVANRDHSLGARDTKDLLNHQWHQGYFENGISFLLFDAMTRHDGKIAFSEAAVYEGDTLFEGRLEMGWRCDDAKRDQDPISFRIHYAKGTLDIDVASFVTNSYCSLTSPNDQYVGVYPSPGAQPTLVLMEQSVKLRLNGKIGGYGCCERTVPGVIAPEA
jgi:hypothetical protein